MRSATGAAGALPERGRADEAGEMAGCILTQDPADEGAWALRVRAELGRGPSCRPSGTGFSPEGTSKSAS